MEVLNPRSALLSNYEVLSLLKELENDHLERSRTAMRIKKEEESLISSTSIGTTGGTQSTHHHNTNLPDISENLRTIQVEAIQYLSSDYLSTNSQTPNGISQLVKDLAPYDLTKAEKLQIVNLAPTLPVELYVIVEELEDRLGDSMDTILSTVKSSLSSLPPPAPETVTINGTTEQRPMAFTSTATSLLQEPTTDTTAATSTVWDDMDADAIIDDMEFIDHGEGAGIEGDLDVEDE